MGFRFREAGPKHVDVIYGGGGPTNDVPEAYLEESKALGDRLKEPDWLKWWSQFEVSTVIGDVNYSATRPGVTVRFVGVELRISISRPQSTIPRSDEARSLARQDLQAALDRIQKKRQSTGYPPIGS
ncbi:hypothetical protein GCM10022256_07680 [Frondihabitans peucedani]|uniref:Uncharacterized protein n=2 Tax=Frondihabitans peucedani TaxID=598626 RepID=A0ABP8DYV5_9MICO